MFFYQELDIFGVVPVRKKYEILDLGRDSLYYFEKMQKNDTSILRTATKETPDVDHQRTRQELSSKQPSLSDTKYEIARVR